MVRMQRVLLAVTLVFASASGVSAVPIEYSFTGHVTTGLGEVAVDDLFSGKFTIESTTPFRVGAPPPNAVYDAVLSFEFSVFSLSQSKFFTGSYSPLDGVEVQVQSDGPDRYFVRAPLGAATVSGDAVNSHSLLGFDFFLADFVSNAVLTNSNLVQDLATLFALFPDRVFTAHYLVGYDGNGNPIEALWNGRLDTLAQTPLPAALPLFATILAGGGLIAWRRKRKAKQLAFARP